MPKKYLILIITFLSLLHLGFGCDNKDDSPVEPETTGVIKGEIIDSETNLPIENVNVYTSPATEFVTTDILGNFNIQNVEPGTYTVTTEKENYTNKEISVTVTAAEYSTANMLLVKSNIESKLYGTISGFVKDASTEASMENVIIITQPATNSVLSSSDGSYNIQNVEAGEYMITASKNNYDTSKITVQVVAGKDSKADFLMIKSDSSNLTKYGKIEGKVLNSISGAELQGVTITADPPLSTVTTDTSGDYKLPNVKPNTYSVTASKNGYVSSTTQVIVVGGYTSKADFALKAVNGSIRGKVVEAGLGQPITGVNISTSPGTSSVSSDGSGDFLISNVPAGTYTISAVKSGYTNQTITVTVESGYETNADITMIKN